MTLVPVVMHAHSEWSYDADWPLDRIARVMPRFGARVVMMCEHDTGFAADRFDDYRAACAAASTPNCLLIPGIEYSDETNSVHLPTWGLDRFLGEARPTLETLESVTEARGAVVFAHPARRDVWSIYREEWGAHLTAIEIWNRKTDGIAPGIEAVPLWQRTGLTPVVGMDFHRRNQLWPLINRVEIDGDLNENNIVAALRAGKTRPAAFGRALIDSNGNLQQSAYKRAERFRRSLKRHIFRSN